jgi:hypothetical protein
LISKEGERDLRYGKMRGNFAEPGKHSGGKIDPQAS